MLKVSLHGTVDDINRFMGLVRQIEREQGITILNESNFYRDKGKSLHSRLLLDVNAMNTGEHKGVLLTDLLNGKVGE